MLMGCTRPSAPEIGPVPVGAKSVPVEHPYVAHPYACRQCHEAQYEFWTQTQHAAAYLSLFAKDSHFDPECIVCHSLGFEKNEGYSKIAHPLMLANPADDPKSAPFIETLMQGVMGDEQGKGAVDSRLEPARYKKLHARYTDAVRRLEQENRLVKLYIGVQCEHCHGNRDGHPGNQLARGPVSQSTCRTCHAPPNAPDFKATMISKIACPLMKGSKKKR
jgi:hypothetical protein